MWDDDDYDDGGGDGSGCGDSDGERRNSCPVVCVWVISAMNLYAGECPHTLRLSAVKRRLARECCVCLKRHFTEPNWSYLNIVINAELVCVCVWVCLPNVLADGEGQNPLEVSPSEYKSSTWPDRSHRALLEIPGIEARCSTPCWRCQPPAVF